MVRLGIRSGVASLLVLALGTFATAQPPTQPGTLVPGMVPQPPGTMTPTTNPGGSTTTSRSMTNGGISLLGLSLLSSDQDAALLATAVAAVQELAQVVPLSADDQLLLVMVFYEMEKWNALAGLLLGGLSGGSAMPTGP